jgi:hypothetical protein
MKQRISTAHDPKQDNPIAWVPAGVDTVCSVGSGRSGVCRPWTGHPGAQPGTSASEITAKAMAAVSAACELQAEYGSISPFDEDGYSTFSEPDSAMLTVLRVAVQVEPDPVETGLWYQRTRIVELDNLTAAQLVSLGRAEEVVGFLVSVRDGRRD